MSLAVAAEVQRGSLNVRLELEAGDREVVAIVGPNGAGKTTILRALAGLEPLVRGRVALGGECLEDAARGIRLAPERRGIGLVPQDVTLFPHLSVLDDVAFGLRCRGVARAAARERAGAWIERLDLLGVESVRPAALSGGQAQRVALARALVIEARLLLLDEPLASVDAAARADLRRTLRAHLDGRRGVCVLVTHDPVDAAALATRVVIVETGRVVQEGALDEVMARPRSAWVAQLARRGSGAG